MRLLLLLALTILAIFIFAPVPWMIMFIVTRSLAVISIVTLAWFVITWNRHA